MKNEEALTIWMPFIGRAMAFHFLTTTELKEKTMGEKALVLEQLGLPRSEVASLLGTNENSIRVLIAREAKKKKKKKKANI